MYKYKIIMHKDSAHPVEYCRPRVINGKVAYSYILYDDNDIEVIRSGWWPAGDIGKLHINAIEAIQRDKKLKPWR